jgi:hypothetical protein
MPDASAPAEALLAPDGPQQAFEQVVAQFGVAAWSPRVAPGDPGACASKYFGKPWLADDEEWPYLGESPALFVLQLQAASLPPSVGAMLGGTGLVQFFYSPDDGVGVARLVATEGVAGNARRNPEGLAHSTPLAILGWNMHEDVPHTSDYDVLGIPDREIAEEHGCDPNDLPCRCLQGDKLGGWPFWSQGGLADDSVPEVDGEQMAPLFQIDGGCIYDGPTLPAHADGLFGGDDGIGHIFFLPSDPSVMEFRWAAA